jgi:hypothetical protein
MQELTRDSRIKKSSIKNIYHLFRDSLDKFAGGNTLGFNVHGLTEVYGSFRKCDFLKKTILKPSQNKNDQFFL